MNRQASDWALNREATLTGREIWERKEAPFPPPGIASLQLLCQAFFLRIELLFQSSAEGGNTWWGRGGRTDCQEKCKEQIAHLLPTSPFSFQCLTGTAERSTRATLREAPSEREGIILGLGIPSSNLMEIPPFFIYNGKEYLLNQIALPLLSSVKSGKNQ